MSDAIGIILREHRSIGAVLHGLLFMVNEIRAGNATPDFALLRAMVRYIDAFPEQLHHPKEDGYLFPAIRARTHDADEAIQRLEEQHARGAVLTKQLSEAIDRYESGGTPQFDHLAELVSFYTRFYWQHMRDEEESVLPIAERVLTESDWKRIDAAFASNVDPLGAAGLQQDLRRLFHRIAMLAPQPIGLGMPNG